jgi:hypothetical protein
VPVHAWNNARNGTWDLPLPVKAGTSPYDGGVT